MKTAISWAVIFAGLTPFALRAYLVGPPEGLDKMASNADIICKAQVVSFAVVTNAAFQSLPGFETRTSRLKIISVLKGNPPANYLWFQHYAANPDEHAFMYAPQHYELATGACYLIFAVKTDRENEYRQIRMSHTAKEDEGAMLTLERALRERASDSSPKVRAGVADAIGNGKIESLLPTLQQLLSDPVGLTNPVPPLTTEDLRAGGRVGGGNNHDVHTAAGYALLKFDVSQVGDLFKANLNDEGFRPNYVCKLAELETGPWLTNLVEVLEARRCRVEQEVETSGVEPKADYLKARMALVGTYGRCWDLVNNYLRDQPAADFADGKMNRCLDALENAGDTGSREPTMLYELYRMKGLNQRAAKFRSVHDNRFAGYDINQFYDRVDAQFSNKVAISNP